MDTQALLEAQGNCCFYCKRRFTKFDGPTRDHVWPKTYGSGLAHNKVMACRKCNGRKGCRLPRASELTRARSIYAKLGARFYDPGDPC